MVRARRRGAGRIPLQRILVVRPKLRRDRPENKGTYRLRRRQERDARAARGGEWGPTFLLGTVYVHAQRRDTRFQADGDASPARTFERRGVLGAARGFGLGDDLHRAP